MQISTNFFWWRTMNVERPHHCPAKMTLARSIIHDPIASYTPVFCNMVELILAWYCILAGNESNLFVSNLNCILVIAKTLQINYSK